ncbi:hypothetical protein EHS25_004787 [Saitozyma podzolica]|uniref:Uncharacterized protein n=1 Tax=Saitozyma podzolica TaxID=1890683 RepID=A0A427Y2T9_9TREE|nr:hypothetical protein EHS25_004787 [Saitozyma podzolica]
MSLQFKISLQQLCTTVSLLPSLTIAWQCAAKSSQLNQAHTSCRTKLWDVPAIDYSNKLTAGWPYLDVSARVKFYDGVKAGRTYSHHPLMLNVDGTFVLIHSSALQDEDSMGQEIWGGAVKCAARSSCGAVWLPLLEHSDTPPRDRSFHLPRGISSLVKGNVAGAPSFLGGLDMFNISPQAACAGPGSDLTASDVSTSVYGPILASILFTHFVSTDPVSNFTRSLSLIALVGSPATMHRRPTSTSPRHATSANVECSKSASRRSGLCTERLSDYRDTPSVSKFPRVGEPPGEFSVNRVVLKDNQRGCTLVPSSLSRDPTTAYSPGSPAEDESLQSDTAQCKEIHDWVRRGHPLTSVRIQEALEWLREGGVPAFLVTLSGKPPFSFTNARRNPVGVRR